MKLAVFGTETNDGLRFIKHALSVGFELNLLATSSAALTRLRSAKAEVIVGTYDTGSIDRCIESCDAVVVLVNEALRDEYLDSILASVEAQSVARLVICEDMQEHDNYDNLSHLSRKLAGKSVDWTVIKRAHQNMSSAITQIDASLVEDLGSQKSFAAYVLNQVTDSRHIGTTVMLTT